MITDTLVYSFFDSIFLLLFGVSSGGEGCQKEEQDIYIETAKVLKGSERRKFMARVVKVLGDGGQDYAQKEFYWSRETITKGKHEFRSGLSIVDNFAGRGLNNHPIKEGGLV